MSNSACQRLQNDSPPITQAAGPFARTRHTPTPTSSWLRVLRTQNAPPSPLLAMFLDTLLPSMTVTLTAEALAKNHPAACTGHQPLHRMPGEQVGAGCDPLVDTIAPAGPTEH